MKIMGLNGTTFRAEVVKGGKARLSASSDYGRVQLTVSRDAFCWLLRLLYTGKISSVELSGTHRGSVSMKIPNRSDGVYLFCITPEPGRAEWINLSGAHLEKIYSFLTGGFSIVKGSLDCGVRPRPDRPPWYEVKTGDQE